MSRSTVVMFVATAVLAAACGSKDEEKKKEEPAKKAAPAEKAKAPAVGACLQSLSLTANLELGSEVECTCGPDQLQNVGYQVWGSGPYTFDSSMCQAAVHAGVIPATGGVIKAKMAAGCKKYVGSEANGIKAAEYGEYPWSMNFTAKGDLPCAP